jgi:Fe-S-cluster containining protein
MGGLFYSDGLPFACTRCNACCRHDPGFVFLSRLDVDALVAHLGMGYSEFSETYCRWVPIGGGVERLSLKEKSNFDCILWGDKGCSVYVARPLQCRTFPFWASTVRSREAWEATSEGCPGIGQGPLHSADEIEAQLAASEAEPIITRGRLENRG